MFVAYETSTKNIVFAVLGTHTLLEFPFLSSSIYTGLTATDDNAVIADPNSFFVDTSNVIRSRLHIELLSDNNFLASDGQDTANLSLNLKDKNNNFAQFVWKAAVSVPGGNPLFSVYFVPGTDIGWAVGGSGVVLKSLDAGVTWAIQAPVTGAFLLSVFFISTTVGWIAGAGGTILSTIDGGITWTPQVSGTVNPLLGINFFDASNGWAVGSAGTILNTIDGGTTWTPQVSGTVNDLKGVTFGSVLIGYAVGDLGTILNTIDGGTTWTTQVSGTVLNLTGISLNNSFNQTSIVYACGSTGTILKTINSGTTWTILVPGMFSGSNFSAVSFSDTLIGWIVGDTAGISIILYTIDGGVIWNQQTTSSTLNFGLSSIYAYTTGNQAVSLSVSIPRTQHARRIEAIINLSSSLNTVPNAIVQNLNAIISHPGFFFQLTSVGSRGTAISIYQGVNTISRTSGSTQRLNGVSSEGISNFLVVVGDNGTIIRSFNDGFTWSTSVSGTAEDLNGVSLSGLTGYAVGNAGTILKTTDSGANWVAQVSGTVENLRGVVTTNGTIAYAVGDTGTILNTIDGGTTWTPQVSGTIEILRSVLNTDGDPTIVFIVGDNGTILNTINSGTTWTSQISGTSQILRGLANQGGGDTAIMLAAGDTGTILKTVDAGSTWTTQVSGTTKNLRAITNNMAMISNYIAVGDLGTILSSTNIGVTWTLQSSLVGVTTNQGTITVPVTVLLNSSGDVRFAGEATRRLDPASGTIISDSTMFGGFIVLELQKSNPRAYMIESADGTPYKLTVQNDGNLVTTPI